MLLVSEGVYWEKRYFWQEVNLEEGKIFSYFFV